MYITPTEPFGKEDVVMLGAVVVVEMTMESCFVAFPEAFVALMEKLDVPAVVGDPEIVPFSARVKPPGNEPLAIAHVIGAVPVAVRV